MSRRSRLIVYAVVRDFGLAVNPDKTRLCYGGGKKIVTGLSVSGDQLALPRATKRLLKQNIYYINKFGFLSHSSKLRNRNPYFLESLIGKFNFWIQAEPSNELPREYLEKLKNLKK